MKNVLFVCTGNICRSPMAEGLFRQMVKERTDVQVGSAGVATGFGQPPSLHAVEVLRPWGIDISRYRSQPLTENLVNKATHIFAMTRGHLDAITAVFPSAAEKTFLVCEFNEKSDSIDIPDPIGMGIDAYFSSRDKIKSSLPSILSFIDQTDQNPSMTSPNSPISKTLRIAIAADHGGFEMKKKLHAHLLSREYSVSDFGCFNEEPSDYPDFAALVCRELLAKNCDFGILICKSGIGMSIAANRYPHVRASLVENEDEARLTRHHNDSNVLCLAAKYIDDAQAARIADAWLQTSFDGGRHERRVEKIDRLAASCVDSSSPLAKADPAIFDAIAAEQKRQAENIELIASENFVSRAVMEAQGSCLTNKYAEGYPGRRWYGGCEHVDVVEQLAIDRAKQLFGAEYANVQPHSGSQANMAVYFSVLQPGDKILTMDLSHGGHLTHGNRANFSGRFFQVSHYGVSRETEQIDYDALARQVEEVRPRMITAGASAYPRIIDFKRMREIADSVGAYLFVDMAHIAGLVAAGVHPSPVPLADFTTTTTHKTLRGPRAGLILAKEKYGKQLDSQVFPGIQGGPLMHVIAAKAVCFLEALQPAFKEYQRQIALNAKSLAARLSKNGYRIVSGGTDNHLMLVDLRPNGLNGKIASETLDKTGITVNKNSIPFDTEKITLGGGIRVGTPAVTTRGMKEETMMDIADLIHRALTHKDDPAELEKIRTVVHDLTSRYPLPQ